MVAIVLAHFHFRQQEMCTQLPPCLLVHSIQNKVFASFNYSLNFHSIHLENGMKRFLSCENYENL